MMFSKGSTARKRFSQVLILLLSLIFLISTAQASSAPRLRIRAIERQGTVKLRIRIKSNYRKFSALRRANSQSFLLLERAHGTDDYSLLAVHKPRRRIIKQKDIPGESGIFIYRAKLQQGDKGIVSSQSTVITISPTDLGADPEDIPDGPPPIQTERPLDLPQGTTPCSEAELDSMIARVNYHRSQAGAAELALHPMLVSAALEHSIFMVEHGFSHSGWLDRLLARGFSTGTAAQNIASYIQDAVAVTDALHESPGHRYNMLNPAHTYIGVACVRKADGYPYWTQYFASFGG